MMTNPPFSQGLSSSSLSKYASDTKLIYDDMPSFPI